MICSSFYSFLESNLFASLVGAFATVIAVRWTIVNEKEKSELAVKEEIKAICSAIKTEMVCCFDLYMEIGIHVENVIENEPFEYIYKVEENYFTIFDGNSSFIGKLPIESRNKIVKAYFNMKSLLDTFNLNNENINRLESYLQKLADIKFLNLIDSELLHKHIENNLKSYKDIGIDLAHELKRKHFKTKESMLDALEALKVF